MPQSSFSTLALLLMPFATIAFVPSSPCKSRPAQVQDPPQAARRADPPVATRRGTRDCSAYGLESLHLGMTLDEARAALTERRIEPRPCGDCAPGLTTFTAEPKKREPGEAVTEVTLAVESERVVSVWVNYVDDAAGNALAADDDAVIAAFIQRFGAPTFFEVIPSTPTSAVQTMGSNKYWKSSDCGVGVALTQGVKIVGSSRERVPLLSAALLPASEIPDRAPPPDTSKVKF